MANCKLQMANGKLPCFCGPYDAAEDFFQLRAIVQFLSAIDNFIIHHTVWYMQFANFNFVPFYKSPAPEGAGEQCLRCEAPLRSVRGDRAVVEDG
jgi:hypothetical protein